MFGCTCLKRKVVLVKGGSKTKHFQRKAAHHRDPVFYDTLGEEAREEEEGIREEEEQLKEKKKRKKLEYSEYSLRVKTLTYQFLEKYGYFRIIQSTLILINYPIRVLRLLIILTCSF